MRRTDSRSSRAQSISNGPAIASMKPLLPSNTSRGPVTPRMARNAACVAPNAAAGYASPFQCDSSPVRVTRSAFSDVPAIAIALAVRAFVEAERPRDAGGDGVGALRGVVKALGAHRRHLGQAVLDLVGDRQRGQQRATVGVRVLGRGEHGREVVAGVTRLTGRQVGVVEVQVADQRAVVERGAVRRAPSHADQRAQRRAAELPDLLADHRHRLGHPAHPGPRRASPAPAAATARVPARRSAPSATGRRTARAPRRGSDALRPAIPRSLPGAGRDARAVMRGTSRLRRSGGRLERTPS